jgi:phosphoribosyl-ATP pyrophosphohydrolase/phosphoribosyl-AMP cyclohydrolase
MEEKSNILDRIYAVIEDRRVRPHERSYVSSLMERGTGDILDKVVEETGELIAGVLNEDRKQVIHEMADLWFHTLVLLGALDVSPHEIYEELEKRWGKSGIEEKESRDKVSR